MHGCYSETLTVIKQLTSQSEFFTAMWPKPFYADSLWEFEPNPSEASALESLLSDGRLVDRDQWNIPLEVVAKRFIRYPFYKSGFSVELLVELPFGEGRAMGVWLVEAGSPVDRPEALDGLAEQDGSGRIEGHSVYFLNGTSPPIHEANAKFPISLPDEKNAAAYLAFFCAHVWAEEGGFWIVSGTQDLPFLDRGDRSSHDDILSALHPPKFLGRNEDGHFLFECWVCYSKALFLVEFAVQSSGMVEMLNDDPKIENLDICEDKRESGLRLLDPASWSEMRGDLSP